MHDRDPDHAPFRLMTRLRPLVLSEPASWLKPTWQAAAGMLAPKPAQTPSVLGRIGALEARLALTRNDIKRAQKLRYQVFYRDGQAIADATTLLSQRDRDAFDDICDHVLVIDHARAANALRRRASRRWSEPTGCCRRRPPAVTAKFYTASEFAIEELTERHPHLRFLELGRSCVLPPYRTKRTVELLWHGVWSYVRSNRFDVMIGCASLDGTDPDRLALPLSFLHHFARAPEEWRAGALAHRAVAMNRMPKAAIDAKRALRGSAAADQRCYSAPRRLHRRRRRDRPSVRHDRRADDPAGVGDQCALHRTFRRGCDATRGLNMICETREAAFADHARTR